MAYHLYHSNKQPRWALEKINKENRAPGYRAGHSFVPIERTINGTLKWLCPILGCQYNNREFTVNIRNGFKRSESYNNHIKRDHSDCVDVSKAISYGHVVFDLPHRVLVCTASQVTILSGTFQRHEMKCTRCANLDSLPLPLDDLTEVLEADDKPIQGLHRLKGLHCRQCGDITRKTHIHSETDPCRFQVVQYPTSERPMKRIFGSQAPPKPLYHVTTIVPPQPAFDYAINSEIPSYVRDHQLEGLDHDSITSKSLSRAESLAKEYANIYFLTAYLSLKDNDYALIRTRLSMSNSQQESKPFDVLTSQRLFQSYMNSFSSVIVLLFRNRQTSPPPLGRLAATCVKALCIKVMYSLEELDEAKAITSALMKSIGFHQTQGFANSLPRKFTAEDVKNAPHTRLELLEELNTQGLDFDNPFNDAMNAIHFLWCTLLLDAGPSPVLKSVVGHFMVYGKDLTDAMLPRAKKAREIVSGLLYSMRLVVWQQTKLRSYTSGLALWAHGLHDSKSAEHISKIYDDIPLDRKTLYSAVWDDIVTKQVICFHGGTISKYSLRAGLQSFVADIHNQLQTLLYSVQVAIDRTDNMTKRMPGYSFFHDDGILYSHIMSESNNMTSIMRSAIRSKNIRVVRKYCETANAFLQQLFVLISLTLISTPNETELHSWTFRNDGALRRLGLHHDLGYFLSRYVGDKEVETTFFMPKTVTNFLVYYLALVRPLVAKLARDILNEDVCPQYSYVIACDYNQIWETDAFLRLHLALTSKYFEKSISFDAWRPVPELIYAGLDGISSSTGHSVYNGIQQYTPTPYRRLNGKVAQFDADRMWSMRYHKYLKLDLDPYDQFYPHHTNEPTKMPEDLCKPPNEDIKPAWEALCAIGKESFTSDEQIQIASMWRSKTSFIGILGRQKGKSLLAQLFARSDPSLVIQMKESGWEYENTLFCNPSEATEFTSIISSGVIKKVIIDDAHLAFNAIDPSFWRNNCPFYLLANDFPPLLTEKVKFLTRRPISVFRVPHRKSYVQYRIISSANIWTLKDALITIIEKASDAEIVVYAPDETSRREVQKIVRPDIRICLPNEMISAVNYQVTHVVHWHHFNSLIQYESNLSLASSSSVKATTLFLKGSSFRRSMDVEVEDFIAAQTYLEGDHCRREIIASFMDGQIEDCFDIPGTDHQFCDVCSKDVSNTPGDRSYRVMLHLCRQELPSSYCHLKKVACPDTESCLGEHQSLLHTTRKYINTHYFDQAVVWCWLEWTVGLSDLDLPDDIKRETSKIMRERWTGEKSLENALAGMWTCEFPKLVAAAIQLSYRLLELSQGE